MRRTVTYRIASRLWAGKWILPYSLTPGQALRFAIAGPRRRIASGWMSFARRVHDWIWP